MFRKIRQFLRGEGKLVEDEDGNETPREFQLAAAAVLLEAAYGDEVATKEELHEVIRDLSFEFGKSRRETKELVGDANDIRLNHDSLRPMISLIGNHFSSDQRVEVLSLVWRVIHADGIVREFEKVYAESLVPLLGLTPEEGEQAVARARTRLGKAG